MMKFSQPIGSILGLTSNRARMGARIFGLAAAILTGSVSQAETLENRQVLLDNMSIVKKAAAAPEAKKSETAEDMSALKKRLESDRQGVAKELTVEGVIYVASGTMVEENGCKIYVIKTPWGIQWPIDGTMFVPNTPYRLNIEYMISEDFRKKVSEIDVAFHDFGQKNSLDHHGNSISVSQLTKALKTDQWLIMTTPTFEPSRHSGYMYLSYSPGKNLGLPADKMPRVKRMWAEPAFDKINDQDKFISNYHAWQQKKLANQRDLENYAANLKHYPQEKWFLTGTYNPCGGIPFASKYFDIEQELYWDIVMRSMKLHGLDTVMMDMVFNNPELLKQYLDTALKYDMKVFGGTMGKPLSLRYSKKADIDKINWKSVDSEIKALTKTVKSYPNLVGYYLCDEAKGFMLAPLLKAMTIFEKYDPAHPALPMGWGMSKYLPIVNTRAGYAFYAHKEDKFNALAWVRDYTDVCRKETNRPLWMILHAFSGRGEDGAKMPSPQQMEAQTYLAFSGKTTGLFYYYYYMIPRWCDWSNGLVDSFMNPNKTCLALSKILGDIRGVGDLCAEQGNYLENDKAGLMISTNNFEKYYSASKKTEVRPQVRYGVWSLPEERGNILVMVNQDMDKAAKATVKISQSAECYDLKNFQKLETGTRDITLSFEPGQGQMFWVGPSDAWHYISNYIQCKRLIYKSELLKIDLTVAQRNGLQLPDMSFLKSKEICLDANRIKIEYEKALAAYNKAVQESPNFNKTLVRLDNLQKKLGQISTGVPYKKRVWDDKTPFSPLKQLVLRAGKIYFDARNEFNHKGLSLAQGEQAEEKINSLIQQINKMPDYKKPENSQIDEILSDDAAFD